jgi:predicted dehydrogenase
VNVVLLEVGHWHAPLYLDALAASGVTVVAASDRDGDRAAAVARRFGARPYEDWRRLLADEAADFAFAFGRHAEMAGLGHALVARGIPFALEKPCGLNAAEVRRLAEDAATRSLFVSVPLVQHFGPLRGPLIEARPSPGPHHAWFRFLGGPPARYRRAGCAWMLDPAQSGGGCFINLGVHFVDLALRILPGVRRVSAHMSRAMHGEAVEDYAVVTLESPDGGTAVLEIGYVFPGDAGRPRETYYSVAGRDRFDAWVDGDVDASYGRFVAETLAAVRARRPPPVGLAAMVPVMEIVDAAYAAARTGRPVIPGG